MSVHEQVQTMASLHSQLQTTARFIREQEQEPRCGGENLETDITLSVMCAEHTELVRQIQELRTEMKENVSCQRAAFVLDNVAQASTDSVHCGRAAQHCKTDDDNAEAGM